MSGRRPSDERDRNERPPQRRRTSVYTDRTELQGALNLGAPDGGWQGYGEGTQVCEL
jgi:hypothetical protein